MKVRLGSIGPNNSSSRYVWVGLTVLLTLGVLNTIVDLVGVPAAQTSLALQSQQRVVIDPKTGAVSGADRPKASSPQAAPKEASAETFDVGKAEKKATPPKVPAQKPITPEGDVPRPTEPVQPSNEASEEILPDDAPALTTAPSGTNIKSVARTKDSLLSAPAPEVAEITPEGALPKRGKGKDVTPAMLYSRNYVRKDDVATIHFVVLGLGFSSDIQLLAQELPPEVSFAFSPYGESLSQAIEAARNDGHEAWIDLPVQTEGYPQDDPGPLGLIATLTPDSFDKRLNVILRTVVGAVGVIFPNDETLSGTATVFSNTLKSIDSRGLIALSTHPKRTISELANEKEIKKILAKSDLVLDDVPNESVIKSKLAGLIDSAKERGQLIVLLHARPQTLILLKNWLTRNMQEGVELAPLSAVILRPAPMLQPGDVEAAPKPAAGHGGGEAKPAAGGH
ncbi:MAG: divergent polysaccharide deacetylase family protein [Alphaproteobacteria bacterium]|nr:divergent polysaccharide deacetylase family protein [Alphaproteobacteria bacterium]